MIRTTSSQSAQAYTDDIERIGIDALLNAFRKHESLGARGIEMVKKNQFGDMAMRGDIEAEKAVLDVLRRYDLPAVIRSEEYGDTLIGTSSSCFGILDGIDGSSWYRSARGIGRYGTLLGLYKGTDPLYKDYLFCGIMEHATKRLLYATKGKGSVVYDLSSGKTNAIHTSQTTILNTQTPIHIDQYWEINKTTFLRPLEGYNILEYHFCSSVHYADVALGKADLALECTRKNNLEIASVFGLIHEAGGTIVTHDGADISNLPYKTFGQITSVPVITAASKKLAGQMVRFLKRRKILIP